MYVNSKEYDVFDESFKGICPMCNKHFDLDTRSFYMCDYKYEGKYFDKRKDERVDLSGETRSTSDRKDFYFDFKKVVEGKDGKVLQIKLYYYNEILLFFQSIFYYLNKYHFHHIFLCILFLHLLHILFYHYIIFQSIFCHLYIFLQILIHCYNSINFLLIMYL